MTIYKRKCPFCKRYHFRPDKNVCKSCQDKIDAIIGCDADEPEQEVTE